MDYLAEAALTSPEPAAHMDAPASAGASPWPGTAQQPSYLRRVQSFPILSETEERALIASWYQRGERRAFDALIASHLRLVPKIAQRYIGYGIPLADLIGEGNLGLLQSAGRFDPTRGFRFSTYARWWIKAAILNHILQSWSLIKIGHGSAKKRMFFNLRRAKAKLGSHGQRYMSDADVTALAQRFGVSRADVMTMDQRLSAQDVSLHQPVKGRDDLTIGDVLPSDGPTPEEALMHNDEHAHRSRMIRAALGTLDRREKEILTKRYLADSPVTLNTLAGRYGITAERVRQIEARAIAKLRHLLDTDALEIARA